MSNVAFVGETKQLLPLFHARLVVSDGAFSPVGCFRGMHYDVIAKNEGI